MGLKEEIKKEIELLPEEYLHLLEQYLEKIKSNKQKARPNRIHLKGIFDNINIRKLAYE